MVCRFAPLCCLAALAVLTAPAVHAQTLSVAAADIGDETIPGVGLTLSKRQFWPHWEGRVGLLADRPYDPLKDSLSLAQGAPSAGLNVRSAHVLSDYYFSGGFRATAGLVRGSVTQADWMGSASGTGLNLSLQGPDILGDTHRNRSFDGEDRTLPYVGAGYSASVTQPGGASSWRFNADLGIITLNNNNIGRVTRFLQGDAGLDEIVRDLRLRPVVKISVRYSF